MGTAKGDPIEGNLCLVAVLQLVGALFELDRDVEQLGRDLGFVGLGKLAELSSFFTEITDFLAAICHRFRPFPLLP